MKLSLLLATTALIAVSACAKPDPGCTPSELALLQAQVEANNAVLNRDAIEYDKFESQETPESLACTPSPAQAATIVVSDNDPNDPEDPTVILMLRQMLNLLV